MAAEDRRQGFTDELRRGRQEAQGLAQEIAGIATDLQTLLQQEMELAKAELRQQASLSVRSLIWGGGAGLLAFLMLTFLSLAAMFALDIVLTLWAAALATAGLLALLTGMAALLAVMRIRQIKVPQRTIHSVQEDVQWAQTQVKSNRR